MEYLWLLAIFTLAGLNEFADGRRGGGGGSRFSGSRSSYRSGSSSFSRSSSSFRSGVRYSTYAGAFAAGYYVSGMTRYNTRYYGTRYYRPDPNICSNVNDYAILDNGTVSQTQKLDYFVCPYDDEDDGDDMYCCGDEGNEYCCSYWESSQKGGAIAGIVIAILVLFGIIFLVVRCCIKSKKASKNLEPSYEYHAAASATYPQPGAASGYPTDASYPPASGYPPVPGYQASTGYPTDASLPYPVSPFSQPVPEAYPEKSQPTAPYQPHMVHVAPAIGFESASPPPSYDAATGYPTKN